VVSSQAQSMAELGDAAVGITPIGGSPGLGLRKDFPRAQLEPNRPVR
jgi:hypothetical protein